MVFRPLTKFNLNLYDKWGSIERAGQQNERKVSKSVLMEGVSAISNENDQSRRICSFEDTGYYYKFMTSNEIKLIKHMLEDNGFRQFQSHK